MFFKCRQKMQIGYQRSNDASKMYFDSSMTLHSIKRHCKWAMFIFSFHFATLDPSSQRVIALSCWARLMVEWILFFWKLRPSRWKLSQIAVAHSSRERHYFLVFPFCLMHFDVCVNKILMSGKMCAFIWCNVSVFQPSLWKCDTQKLSGRL